MKSWFTDLRLAVKLAIGFGLTLCLTMAVAWTSLSGVGLLKHKLHVMSDGALAGTVALSDFNTASSSARMKQFRVSAMGGVGDVKGWSKQADDAANDADKALTAYAKTIHDPENQQLADKIAAAWNQYKQEWKAIESKVIVSNAKENIKMMEQIKIYRSGVVPSLQKEVNWNQRHWDAASKSADEAAAEVAKAVTIMSGFALGLGILFGCVISGSITRPLSHVSKGLESLSEHCVPNLGAALRAFQNGDLSKTILPVTQPIAHCGKDEVGRMATMFNIVLGAVQESIESYNSARVSLSSVVRTLSTSSKSVLVTSQSLAASAEQSGTAAGEIAGGSEKLARGATESAAIMEELAAQVENVNKSGEGQEASVLEASRELAESRLSIRAGNEAVGLTVNAMQRVTERVTKSADKVRELDGQGKQIGRIVQSIEAIAEQTNLLALNAAIEAARAGEHGRGFSVVADEVRKLAEKASEATKEISALIEGVTLTVAETVGAIEATRKEVEDGTARSEAARTALDQILSASERIEKTMAVVAISARDTVTSTQEMMVAAERVAQSISNVAAVSEESAAGAEELSASIQEVGAAANELSSMSHDLQVIVAKFRLEEDQHPLRLAA